MMINLGRAAPLVLEHIRKVGVPAENLRLQFEEDLGNEAALALDSADKFVHFTYTFPLWYRGRYYAELVNPTRIKFTPRGSTGDRRVSAYHKGFRPPNYLFAAGRPPEPPQITEAEALEFVTALRTCWPNGSRGFFYPRPFSLLMLLYKKYSDRLTTAFRRDPSLSLGGYSLHDFGSFYAALLAICSVHEHLCYQWSKHHQFPLNSAVLVKSRKSWATNCSLLCGLPNETIDAMITDLSFGSTRPLDLHIHPFVPLSEDSQMLAVVPHFPLYSAADENILRVCSHIKRDFFDAASLGKEEETRQELGSVIGNRFAWNGPVSLPSPRPDIDMLISDAASSTLLLCELKWIRKPLLALEYERADPEFQKGLKQLKTIQEFLIEHPSHLKQLKATSHKLTDFQHVYYVLVARDHFLWTEPLNSISVIDFEPFKAMLAQTKDLHAGMETLLQYKWLPEEGRDYEVRNQYAISNGVASESEIYYPMHASGITLLNPGPMI
jgi:hypothetical protein